MNCSFFEWIEQNQNKDIWTNDHNSTYDYNSQFKRITYSYWPNYDSHHLITNWMVYQSKFFRDSTTCPIFIQLWHVYKIDTLMFLFINENRPFTYHVSRIPYICFVILINISIHIQHKERIIHDHDAKIIDLSNKQKSDYPWQIGCA